MVGHVVAAGDCRARNPHTVCRPVLAGYQLSKVALPFAKAALRPSELWALCGMYVGCQHGVGLGLGYGIQGMEGSAAIAADYLVHPCDHTKMKLCWKVYSLQIFASHACARLEVGHSSLRIQLRKGLQPLKLCKNCKPKT